MLQARGEVRIVGEDSWCRTVIAGIRLFSCFISSIVYVRASYFSIRTFVHFVFMATLLTV
jgi:hypothetical protein